MLVILTLHSRPEDTTANLLGPVVVNVGNGQAVQAVLSGSGYEPQVPLRPPAASRAAAADLPLVHSTPLHCQRALSSPDIAHGRSDQCSY